MIEDRIFFNVGGGNIPSEEGGLYYCDLRNNQIIEIYEKPGGMCQWPVENEHLATKSSQLKNGNRLLFHPSFTLVSPGGTRRLRTR